MFKTFCLCAALALSAPAAAFQYADFSDTTGLSLNGPATVIFGSVLRLVPRSENRRGSVFTDGGVGVAKFKTSFSFRVRGSGGTPTDCEGQTGGEGLTFTMHRNDPTAIGTSGSGLGYAGIANSFAIEFDSFCNLDRNDPSSNHVGLLLNGSTTHMTLPTRNVLQPFDSGRIQYVWIDYDGAVLEVRVSIRDSRPSNPHIRRTINIPALIGGDVCCVGFTAGTSGAFGSHELLNWEYIDESPDADDAPPFFGNTAAVSSEKTGGSASGPGGETRAPRLVCRNRVATRSVSVNR